MNDVRAALTHAQQLGLDRLDAQLLLCHLLQKNRAWLISHDDAPLSADMAQTLAKQFQQRADGMPVAYLTGEKEFHGLRLRVTPDTLIPRPDTETLVDWALEILRELPGQPRVLDLGTGSGAIALALKASLPAIDMHALDFSPGALAVARQNAQTLGLPVHFHQGDWWQPVAGQRFDLIVSNPPYIAGEDHHLPALRFEPLSALTPGADDQTGLRDLLTLINGAPSHLQPGAFLLLEHGYDQADAVAGELQRRGFVDLALRHDLGAQPRVSGGRWPG
ncbi:peptide chain release factor N(5)-glutamine methyltransferase [Roseateles koreensis]|uniref:Release factor glutamine methyltransferase n=1 Tax=Roseateles koreensis TaxID=2987526 RepID=A0ABT5KQA8_9BURK|nr:peptide chain release factor N(5)-glutamine methyltransferase [Roseateles koreensis]MDC8783967.1 peptide chain release factor N(5)-glutamine methyltransferase [Roseateles koreensis]